MKTETPDVEVKLGVAPAILPVTSLPKNIHPGFVVGENDRIHDARIVAYAIMVRADYKIGERVFSASSLGLHEAVIMKRFYDELGGTVTLDSSWPPGLARLRPLTQEQLQVELARFKTTFVIPQEHGIMEITPQFLGTEPADQLRRLHALMIKQMAKWASIMETAKARIPAAELKHHDGRDKHPDVIMSMACDHITPRELQEIANIADPTREGIDAITLPEVFLPSTPVPVVETEKPVDLAAIQAQADAEVDAALDPTEELNQRLQKELSLEPSKALALVNLVESIGEGVTLADDDIIAVLGSKAKLAGVRRILKG